MNARDTRVTPCHQSFIQQVIVDTYCVLPAVHMQGWSRVSHTGRWDTAGRSDYPGIAHPLGSCKEDYGHCGEMAVEATVPVTVTWLAVTWSLED